MDTDPQRSERKRPPSDIAISPTKVINEELHGNAQVEGVIVELSPLKKTKTDDSKYYFDGRLSDDAQTLRFIGFSDKLHDDLTEFHQKREPVLLKNCNLHKGKRDRYPQLFINEGRTTVHRSDSLFDLKPGNYHPQPVTATIEDLPTLDKYQRVNITAAKVIKVKPPVIVGQEVTKQIQKVTIADENAYATIQLWEEDINKLTEGQSYKLNNITCSEYYGDRYFTFSTQSTVTEIPDIGPVMKTPEDSDGQSDALNEYDDAYIVGIAQFSRVEKCLYKQCKGKLVPSPSNAKLATCSTCQMMQRLDNCSMTLSAKIVVKGDGLPANLTLYATGAHLMSITGLPQDSITKEDILLAPPFGLTHRGSTLTGVYRKVPK